MKLIYDHSSNFFFYWLLSCTRSCVTVADLIPRATQLKAKFYIVIAQVSFHKFAKGDRLDMEIGYIDLTGQLCRMVERRSAKQNCSNCGQQNT